MSDSVKASIHDTTDSIQIGLHDTKGEIGLHQGTTQRISTSFVDTTPNINVGLHDIDGGIKLNYSDFGAVIGGSSGGGGGGSGNANVYRDYTASWNAKSRTIAEEGAIYVYLDHAKIDNGNGIYTIYPAIKIGDGTSYLIDMPFVDGELSPMIQNHINNNIRHVTAEEKDFWNNKWRGYMNSVNDENLVFTIH